MTSPNLERYHRQMLLPDLGEEGQRRLARSRALVVGVGALGCVSAEYLVRAGVGRVTLVDRDTVEWTNLQRQTLYGERDAAQQAPKADAAARALQGVNSGVIIEGVAADFAGADAEALLLSPVPADVLVDGTDNFETRYVLNDAAVKHGIPLVYGGAVGTRGMQATIVPGSGPCLRCLAPDLPAPGSLPTCDTAGVLGPVAGIVGACQAVEAIKVLLGRIDLVSTSLLEFDPWHGMRRRLPLGEGARDPACACCVRREFTFLEGRDSRRAVVLCGRGAVQVSPPASGGAGVDLDAMARRLDAHGRFVRMGGTLRGQLDRERGEAGAVELTLFADGRAIIRGAADPAAARAIYDRYIGG